MQVLAAGAIGIILGAIGFWGRLSVIIRLPSSLFFTSKRVDASIANILVPYLINKYKRLTINNLYYFSILNYVKPLKYIRRVFFENLTISSQVFLNGWKPIWFSVSEGVSGREPSMKLTYVRGALDWEELLEDISEKEYRDSTLEGYNRFAIIYHGGRSNFDDSEPQEGRRLSKMSATPAAVTSGLGFGKMRRSDGVRFIRWLPEQLGNKDPITLGSMSIRPELQTIVDEVRFFLESRSWFEDRGIPWRRGWLLYGKPGTGKTSLVRGIAVEFNLPIHVLDLSSMGNAHLRMAWDEISAAAPCIVLIEDIDSVFRGRDNITKRGGVTFDSLLNCISGITPSDGILVFVTSNNFNDIDPALLRGGRLDRSVLVEGLDYEGKIKLAERILEDKTEAIAIANDVSYEKVTPAELQEVLSRIAIKRRFG